MKKLILSIFAVTAFISTTLAQPFTLTADGFRSVDDKDYVVINVPEVSQEQLFQRAKAYFTKVYNSPQNVMSESGVDMISVMGTESVNFAPGGTMGGRASCSFSYKLICEFKDGRAKITPVWIDLYGIEQHFPIRGVGGFTSRGVYKKTGELRDDKAKFQIESIINPLVTGLEQALKQATAPTSEDW